MTANRLLRLYPKPWRDRYGEEFLELMGEERLGVQQQFDIVMGAIDAHLAWSAPTGSTNINNQEARVMAGLRSVCAGKGARMTTRDGLIGAGMYLGATLLFVVIGTMMKRNGMDAAAEMTLAMAFPVSLVFAMPVTFMKGQPLRAQAAVMGATLGILALISYVAYVAN